MLKLNDIISLKIKSITNEGSGVGRYDGMAVFVPYTAVGDTVLVKITKVFKSYAVAEIHSVLEPSLDRIEPDCGLHGQCGGCELRHISYGAELEAKRSFVIDAFERIGKLELSGIQIHGGNPVAYRNKVQFKVSQVRGKLIFGFYSKRSHSVIPLQSCALLPEIFTEIAGFVTKCADKLKISAYDEKTDTGLLRHIYIRRGYRTDELMVCLVSAHNDERYKVLFDEVSKKFSPKTCVLNINSDRTSVVLGKKSIVFSGNGYIKDIMCESSFLISPHSFYQVNTPQAEELYKNAYEFANASKDDILLDLYCGIGTIGISMARDVKKLIGVEIVGEAVNDARKNAELNGIKNAEFFEGDAGEVADKLLSVGISPSVIIADPARKGCDKRTLDAMVEMNPKRIVMVSCNPSTAARDISYLCARGYELKKAEAYDLFPRTAKVECVILIKRITNNQGDIL